jgi:hypothetical protein
MATYTASWKATMAARTALLGKLKPHAVYRCFDATGELLYVGCSSDPFVRRWHGHTHVNGRRWADFVVRITANWYPDLATARPAERHAILTERPAYNCQTRTLG